MNRREGFKAMNAKLVVLPEPNLNYKLKPVSNEDWEKKVWIFLGLSARENPDKTRLTSSSFSNPLCSASLCRRPLFSLFSGALLISFSRCSLLETRLFTYTFSLFSFAFLLPYSAYFSVLSNFLARFSRLALRLLLLASLVPLSLSFQPIFTQNPFSTNLNYNNFLRLRKL